VKPRRQIGLELFKNRKFVILFKGGVFVDLTKKRNYLFNKKEEYFSDLMKKEFSAVITKGELYFVALCPELGVVSQGSTEKEALNNLNEAVELYLEDKDVQKSLEKNPIKKAVISTITLPA